MKFFDFLKSCVLLLLIINFAPPVLTSIRKQYGKLFEQRTCVGVITMNSSLDNSTLYIKHLNAFFKDPSIKAILIKMDCPGGTSGTSQAIHDELRTLKKEYPKHVEVLVENICASGGYYIASAADHITAPGTALIGSIGSYFPYFFQLREFIEHWNIHYTTVKAGAFKTASDPFVDITPAERALLQSVADDTYDQFTHDVAHNRNLAINQTATWADGKLFSGRQALKLGLIDELGSAATAISSIKQKALIEGEIEWIHAQEEGSWFDFFGGSPAYQEEMAVAAVTNKLGNVLAKCSTAQRLY